MAEPGGDLIIVTGMTGAGRSTAAKALEDLGLLRHRQPAAPAASGRRHD